MASPPPIYIKFATARLEPDSTPNLDTLATVLKVDGVPIARFRANALTFVRMHPTRTPVKLLMEVVSAGPVQILVKELNYLHDMYPECEGELRIHYQPDSGQPHADITMPFGGHGTAAATIPPTANFKLSPPPQGVDPWPERHSRVCRRRALRQIL